VGGVVMAAYDPDDFYCPSVDVCAWCSDMECDGIGCIARLDPHDLEDQPLIEELHATLRAGRVFINANVLLALAENRDAWNWTPPGKPEAAG
jgi:hypothetical protein